MSSSFFIDVRVARGLECLRSALFALTAIAATGALHGCGAKPQENGAAQTAPALAVQVAVASKADWPETIQVPGPIAAWQEAIIGAEIAGQRLTELKVNVGDRVKKGEVLARFNTEILQAEQAELQALWQQAEADRVRAVALEGKGALSRQQIENYIQQAAVAKARLDAKNLQLRYATVVAPADGVISARSATLGAIGTVGAELFRLIVDHRLEWRGELSAEQLPRVKPGQTVALTLPDGGAAQAKIRQLSPSLDARSRMATVYADIAPGSRAHAGMYVSGTIAMQERPALVVPAVSVVIRDGRSYVFTVDAATSDGSAKTAAKPADGGKSAAGQQGGHAIFKVTQREVSTGRHRDKAVEIVSGLGEGARVITQGAGFLNEGDSVRVVGEAGAQP